MQRGERGAVAARLAVVVAGLLAGAGLGYAAAGAERTVPTEIALARPFPAASPSVPTDPPITTVADPTQYAPLGTDLDFVRRRVGVEPNRWIYDVPRGWEPAEEQPDGVRWTLPGNPVFTYSMRVAIIDNLPITTAQTAVNRRDNVRGLEGYQQLALTDNDLQFTYVLDQHARYQNSYWISEPRSDRTAFEITVSGRLSDREGLDALLEHLVASTHRTVTSGGS